MSTQRQRLILGVFTERGLLLFRRLSLIKARQRRSVCRFVRYRIMRRLCLIGGFKVFRRLLAGCFVPLTFGVGAHQRISVVVVRRFRGGTGFGALRKGRSGCCLRYSVRSVAVLFRCRENIVLIPVRGIRSAHVRGLHRHTPAQAGAGRHEGAGPHRTRILCRNIKRRYGIEPDGSGHYDALFNLIPLVVQAVVHIVINLVQVKGELPMTVLAHGLNKRVERVVRSQHFSIRSIKYRLRCVMRVVTGAAKTRRVCYSRRRARCCGHGSRLRGGGAA